MIRPPALRERAEAEAGRFPPLLARAEHLAGTILLGEHGRRRSGPGDDFWQYRAAQPGDSLRMIDHRRSARGDQQYVREREWQIAQSVTIWVDQGASMRFAGGREVPEKIDRARLLALAAAILLIRGGERVGLAGTAPLPPRRGRAQLVQLAAGLVRDDPADHAALPDCRVLVPRSRSLFISDFLGNMEGIRQALAAAADRGVRGVLMQVLDPVEEAFPYRGRSVFESVGGTLRHETLEAGHLRARYLQRLAARKEALRDLCRATGWQAGLHLTRDSAQSALLWIWRALDGGRR